MTLGSRLEFAPNAQEKCKPTPSNVTSTGHNRKKKGTSPGEIETEISAKTEVSEIDRSFLFQHSALNVDKVRPSQT